jgi:hypothetical protein
MGVPRRFVAVLTRNLLAELVAPTYAAEKQVELNDAAEALIEGLRAPRVIEPLQRGTWAALVEAKPKLDDDAILELVERRLAKSRRFKAMTPKRTERPGLAAVILSIDEAAGLATQASAAILEAPEGQRFLTAGYLDLGRHRAAELLR